MVAGGINFDCLPRDAFLRDLVGACQKQDVPPADPGKNKGTQSHSKKTDNSLLLDIQKRIHRFETTEYFPESLESVNIHGNSYCLQTGQIPVSP